MNELLKLLQEISERAYISIKKCEYAIKGYINNKKVEAVINNFNPYERYDINFHAHDIVYLGERPNTTDITRYMRNAYGDKYPMYLEVIRPNRNVKIVLMLVAITENEALNKYDIIGVNNGYGKIYNYKEYVLDM